MTKAVLNKPEQKKEQGVYSKPQLIEFGKVEEITQGGSGAEPEFASHKFVG
jgi:hypothetical protein